MTGSQQAGPTTAVLCYCTTPPDNLVKNIVGESKKKKRKIRQVGEVLVLLQVAVFVFVLYS